MSDEEREMLRALIARLDAQEAEIAALKAKVQSQAQPTAKREIPAKLQAPFSQSTMTPWIVPAFHQR